MKRLPEPNPVLLFELRQAVRNRFVNGLLLIYLTLITAMFCFTAWANALAAPTIHGTLAAYVSDIATLQVLRLLLVYYAFTTATLVLFGAVRTASDLLSGSPALSTTLSPRQIVSGKMQFGLVIGLLFLSVTFPLMTGAYLMRGLDITTIFTGALFGFCMVQIQYFVTVAIFSAADTTGRLIAAVLTAAVLHVFLAYFVFFLFDNVENFWPGDNASNMLAVFMVVFLVGFIMAITFIFAVVRFTPKSENRMLPVRVLLTAVQAFLTAMALLVCVMVLSKSGGTYDIFYTVVYILNFLFWMGFPFTFALFICERETLSWRIRKTIPKKFVERLFVFPFYTGAAGAMVWCVLALGSEYLIHLIINLTKLEDFRNNWSSLNFGLMFFNYCATVLLLYNVILKRWIDRQWNWTLPLVVVGLMLTFVVFASFISEWLGFSFNPWDFFERFPVLPIPWGEQYQWLVEKQIYISRLWFLVLAVVGTPWIYRHFKEFGPLEANEAS